MNVKTEAGVESVPKDDYIVGQLKVLIQNRNKKFFDIIFKNRQLSRYVDQIISQLKEELEDV